MSIHGQAGREVDRAVQVVGVVAGPDGDVRSAPRNAPDVHELALQGELGSDARLALLEIGQLGIGHVRGQGRRCLDEEIHVGSVRRIG